MSLNRSLFAGLIGRAMEPMPALDKTPEMRAMWILRFEWSSSNEATAKANFDGMMKTLADKNFNSVFFQVRGRADVQYLSPDEPWSNTFGWTNPGWDPLVHAIRSARIRGWEFHAYCNTHILAIPIPPTSTPLSVSVQHEWSQCPRRAELGDLQLQWHGGTSASYYRISPANTEAESMAPGRSGQGGSWIGHDGLGATGTFGTAIPACEISDVALKLHISCNGPNNHTGIINTGNRFNMDAVRLTLTALPVVVWEWVLD
jgi:hypothetical protein